jgi:hypothetical protein
MQKLKMFYTHFLHATLSVSLLNIDRREHFGFLQISQFGEIVQ